MRSNEMGFHMLAWLCKNSTVSFAVFTVTVVSRTVCLRTNVAKSEEREEEEDRQQRWARVWQCIQYCGVCKSTACTAERKDNKEENFAMRTPHKDIGRDIENMRTLRLADFRFQMHLCVCFRIPSMLTLCSTLFGALSEIVSY